MYNNLPEELLLLIFVRLPVLSLLRFRCVCKSWYFLITNSNFILQQVNHPSNHSVLFRQYLTDSKNDIYTLHSDDQQFREIETLHSPLEGISDYFTIIGCVNGLICLRDSDSNTLFLWNPAIRKYFTLPKRDTSSLIISTRGRRRAIHPNLDRSARSFMDNKCFGFGYDVSSDDYKVVGVIHYARGFKTLSLVAVFSFRSKSWRTLDHSCPSCLVSHPCNVGGFVYRLMKTKDNRLQIVSFDLRNDVFTEIACPRDIVPVLYRTIDPTNIRDSLGLIDEWSCKQYHIWVMKEDGVAKSWMKLFSVNLYLGVSLRQRIIGFSKKGQMLVVGLKEGGLLVSPVVEDAQVVKYVPPGRQCAEAWHSESYKESLVLLMEGDDLPLLPPRLVNPSSSEADAPPWHLAHQLAQLAGMACVPSFPR